MSTFGQNPVDNHDRQLIEQFLARLPAGSDVTRSREYALAHIGALLPALDRMPSIIDRGRAVIVFMSYLVATCDVHQAEAAMWADADIPASQWPKDVSNGARNLFLQQLIKDGNRS